MKIGTHFIVCSGVTGHFYGTSASAPRVACLTNSLLVP